MFQVYGGLRGAVGVSFFLAGSDRHPLVFVSLYLHNYFLLLSLSDLVDAVLKIALAIALDNEVRENANEDDYEELYVDQTQMAFAFIGGIAFMTLTINGVTAGPLLRKLGLADSTESREKIINAYQARFKAHLIGTS